MTFWNMQYGDQLRVEIKRKCSPRQRKYFLNVVEDMCSYLQQNDECLTFREFYDMMCYNNKEIENDEE